MSAADPGGVLLGRGLAANLGVKPGDSVVLVTTTTSGGVNAVELRVIGLFATITKAYDDSALRAPIAVVRKLLRVSGVHSYAIVLDETENTSAVTASLRNEFQGQPLQFVPWYQLADFYNKTAELFSRQVSVLRMIIAAIIVLSISNSMMMSVLERTGEIGTAMALGTRRSKILHLFLTEGVLLGVIGGSVGLVAGYGLASIASAIGIPMPAPPGMATGYTAGILVSWPLAFDAVVLAIATTLLASIYPSWRASRMTVVDALRRNR
jgi:putative ABC transport system permease protein